MFDVIRRYTQEQESQLKPYRDMLDLAVREYEAEKNNRQSFIVAEISLHKKQRLNKLRARVDYFSEQLSRQLAKMIPEIIIINP